MSVRRTEKLAQHHAIDDFDCGNYALNQYLARFAWQNQRANAAVTYVGLVDDAVAGFFTLTVGEVANEAAPDRLAKGLARHPVPIMVLARLAVDVKWQGRGIGAGLLRDALLRTLSAADMTGIRALVVHAKDQNAQSFYQHYGFTPFPEEPLHLYLLVKDIRR